MGTQVVINTFSALLGEEAEVAQGFMLASLYVLAINQDESPRAVLESLFKALPDDSTWPELRTALLRMGGDGASPV